MYIAIPLCVCAFLTIGVTVSLDSLYQSSATILIERQGTTKEMAASAAGGFLEERFRSIAAIVQARKPLEAIIEEQDVYPELKEKMTVQALVSKMREDIVLEQVKDDDGSLSMGRQPHNTLTFVLRFQHTNPETAARVVTAMTKLFFEKDESSRESKGISKLAFLSEQVEQNQHEIDRAERNLTTFKNENLLSLPQLMDVNMKAMDDLQREIKIKEIQLVSARDRLIYLEGQLAVIPPTQKPYMSENGRILSMEDQLEALRSQYLNLKATHSDQHPDVVRLRSQIDALGNASSLSGQLQQLHQRLEEKETSRSLLLERVSPEHPDIKAVERDIETVRGKIEALVRDRSEFGDQDSVEPDNPVYISMLTKLESAKLEVGSLERIVSDLTGKLDEYQARIEQMPRVEQAFLTLQRQYNYLLDQHQENYRRYQTARETFDLEFRNISETYTLIEPPIVAEKPIKPNRPLLFVLGMMFSMGVAGAVSITAEYLDHSIHTPTDLAEITGVRVLGSVPVISMKKKRNMKCFFLRGDRES
ncbi:lipopolysaccharide biosynthesis protein [Desulfovibrio ferrophilus]|uniref:Lipopolysaccharide biosynthesis protein n=2 Tax=Desulfovibrio ferrophilus TaxID=241368 RepID=A0A2Z6B187_9BACT|nr:lipopolysaccharide biosynthesis protein [Desulfovibrio ferrophilus]